MKRVSVIVPVYNVERYIERCVCSLLEQTYSDVEYIFIDDCGQDNSVGIAKRIIAEYPRKEQVKWITPGKNQGPSVARNMGVEQAGGEYIFFVDSDDYITPDCIEMHMAYMEKYRCDMVIGWSRENRLYRDGEIYQGYLCGAWSKTSWNRLVNKDFLRKNHITFKPGMIYEDFVWNMCVALEAKSIYTFKAKTYFYLIHEDSCSRKITDLHFRSFAKLLDEMLVIFQEKGLTGHKESVRFFELCKFRGMDSLITNYSDWKKFRTFLKVKLVPTWKLLLGLYGLKIQKRAFLAVVPYFLYKPLAGFYEGLVKRSCLIL